MPLQLTPIQAERFNVLGLRGNSPGKRRTYIGTDRIAAVKQLIEEGYTHERITRELGISSKTITGINRGEYDDY